MKSKAFAITAVVLVNVIMTVIAVLGLLVQQPFVKPEVVPYIVFAGAVLNLILKLWFPGTPSPMKWEDLSKLHRLVSAVSPTTIELHRQLLEDEALTEQARQNSELFLVLVDSVPRLLHEVALARRVKK